MLLAIELTVPTPSACACRAVGDDGMTKDSRLSHTVTSSAEALHEEDEDEEEDGGEGRSVGASEGAGADRDRGAGWDRAAIDLTDY